MKASTTTPGKNKYLEARIEECYFQVQEDCSAAARVKLAMRAESRQRNTEQATVGHIKEQGSKKLPGLI